MFFFSLDSQVFFRFILLQANNNESTESYTGKRFKSFSIEKVVCFSREQTEPPATKQ